jgi:hypothetical protein
MAPPRGPQSPHYGKLPSARIPPAADPPGTIGALWMIPLIIGVPAGGIMMACGGSGAGIIIVIVCVLAAFFFAAIHMSNPPGERTPRFQTVKAVPKVRHKPRPWGAL